jgi:hypothetical protein
MPVARSINSRAGSRRSHKVMGCSVFQKISAYSSLREVFVRGTAPSGSGTFGRIDDSRPSRRAGHRQVDGSHGADRIGLAGGLVLSIPLHACKPQCEAFREHSIILPALAGRLGYPPTQAAYAVNSLFQAASIVLVQLIAAHLVSRCDARARVDRAAHADRVRVRIRANQEYAVLSATLLALLATERSRRRPA